MTPKVERTTSNDASANGSASASPSWRSIARPSATARPAPPEQGRHVVDADGVAEAPGGGEGGRLVGALPRQVEAVAVVRRMVAHGVIASPIGPALEMAPPPIVGRAGLDPAAEVTARAIGAVTRERGLA